MITAASLKSLTVKTLAQMAKQRGVSGWHSMRKDELVRALLRVARANSRKTRRAASAGGKSKRTAAKTASSPPSRSGKTRSAGRGKAAATGKSVARSSEAARKNSRAVQRIHKVNAERSRQKDLAGKAGNGALLARRAAKSSAKAAASDGRARVKNKKASASVEHWSGQRDRIVLLVRDPYWLQACWEVTRQSVQRARAATAEHWHTARPVLRLIEVELGSTTSSAERVVRDIEIHGGVNTWFIDVQDSPKSFRMDIGYLAGNGRFYTLARSNQVTTPTPGGSDAIDENWADVADDYDKIYALSGGYSPQAADSDLRRLFEERLRRPMGTPVVTRFGAGAERLIRREGDFSFDVDAEMIIYGATTPDAHVTLTGKPVTLRPDGSFTVRVSMPNRRQVVPVVANSGDGVEQRTIVLAVERNTKVMEPVVREGVS